MRSLIRSWRARRSLSGALDRRPHGRKAEREIADLRIACRIQDFGLAAREHRCHQGGLGRSGGRRAEHNACAAQALCPGARVNIAALNTHFGSEYVESLQVLVDRPRAYRAASGQRHLRRAETSQQRRQDKDAGPHAAHQFVRSLCATRLARIQQKRMRMAAARDDAKFRDQIQHGFDVGYVGDIAQFQELGAKERSGNLWQSGIFRP
jgi:hypothetical protein